MRTNTKKRMAKAMISFAAVGMIALTAPLHVFAADETATQSLAVYSIDINDANAMDTLKQQAIDSYVKANGSVKADDIDASASFISVEGLSLNHTGLQTVSISLQPAVYTNAEHTTSTLQQAWTTSAAVTVTSTGAPRVVLKQDEVTVDYQSNFSYADNIAILSTSSGSLPVIQETDNVDVNTEGTYTCTVTAIDERGQKTTVSYSVVVKKPAEVVRAEEEAAKKAAEEAAAQEAAQKAAEEAAAQQAAQEAAAAAMATTTTVSANVAANPTGSSIADYALSFAGSAYVYGGSSPSGFDCSGFTQYVYAAFGYSLPRTSYGQEAAGTIVSVADAQPGDLVTYNGHAGIYIGNGQMVNAMNPTQGVAVCSIYAITNGNMLIHRIG
ncbi:MAG: NlpC/P60 family protein [Lactimicrobium massiliense]|nr:NlpC/P60 family protein [Lactimicrobium massiliense]